jgi:hypothetical protein
MKTVFLCFHRVIVEDPGLLGCCAVWLSNFFADVSKKPIVFIFKVSSEIVN